MAASVSKTVTESVPVSLATGVKSVIIYNQGPYMIWIGGSDVSVEKGIKLQNQERIELPLGSLEQVYAIAEGGDADVRVFTTNVI